MIAQELLGVLPALADALRLEAIPGTALFNEFMLHGEIEDVPFARHALPVHDVELGLAERWRHLVLHDLGFRAVAHYGVAIFDRGDAADVHAHRRIELQRPAARGGFGVAEHHANLLADLVDEDQAAVRFRNDSGELA